MWWWPGYYVWPFMRSDVTHKLCKAEGACKLWARGRVNALAKYLRRGWGTFFQHNIADSGWGLSGHDRFTQRRLSEIEEFYDMQTPGGDHQGDVWLYDMGKPEVRPAPGKIPPESVNDSRVAV